MLLSDQLVVSQASISAVDSQASTIASAEGIALAGTYGIFQRATDECIEHLLSQAQSFSTYYGDGSASAAHNAAVSNVGGSRNTRARTSPFQIAFSSDTGGQWSTLQLWATMVSLRLLYRSALNNNLIDHYAKKVDFLDEEIKKLYWPQLRNKGIPILFQPLPRPAAVRNLNPGTWSASNLSASAGSGSAGTWDVQITYVDQVGNQPYGNAANDNNAESAPSEIATIVTSGSQNVVASIVSLNPPTGWVDRLDIGLFVPRSASGWNVYAGPTGSTLTLQNVTAPIPVATKTFSFPVLGGVYPVSTGQKRDSNLFFFPYFNRV